MRILDTVAMAAALVVSPVAQARQVPAWTASTQPVWGSDFLFPTGVPERLANTTFRQVIRIGYGGRNPRIVLSNAYGVKPVRISGAHLAPAGNGASIRKGGDRTLLFGGARSVVIPAGATVVSDAAALDVSAGDRLSISLLFEDEPTVGSFHWDGRSTSYILAGDQLGADRPSPVATSTVRLFLSGLLVDDPAARGTVVVLGDSITDGAGATLDRDSRWPDFLARRAAVRGIAVVNAGISGARLLGDRMGSNALARLDRDVLAQPGVRTLVVMIGINDIAWPGTPFAPGEPPMTFEEMVAGYRALVARAHTAGVRVVGATLTPFAGALPGTPLSATYHSATKDALRVRINGWIRSSGVFDQVIDFDRLLRDPAATDRLAARYDSGDRLHPGDAGDEAMANAVDLETLIGDVK